MHTRAKKMREYENEAWQHKASSIKAAVGVEKGLQKINDNMAITIDRAIDWF